MEHIRTIWPSVKELSDDLGLKYTTVHSWIARGRIPASRDLDLVRAAARRGHRLTLDHLAQARAVKGNAPC